ncbi:MAG: DUF1850 domain-containing protein [Candidatus Atribacteria bacterium]|nr:DUF1850 domain-containing protein [Candidatus Atribacteria bacterium]MCK4308637.1 DUF1850 domain-containing protein [Candidatus Atribacteria bacterium]
MLGKSYNFIFLGLAIITIVIILLFSISIYTLELRSFSDDGLIFRQKIQPGDKFTLKYIHSVALTPIWEIFIIDDRYQIILVETDFMDHGAGMPYASFDQEIFIEEEGKFKIKNMHRIMPNPILYMVGRSSENCLYIKDKEINLSFFLGDKLLTIGVNKNNLYNYFLGGNL